MIEYKQAEQGEFSDSSEFGIKVIGIGGAGANVLDRMALEGSDDAELLTLNTDIRALSTSVSTHKIQLGATLLKGMGTGGDPTLGKQAAIEAVDEIRKAVRSSKMVFVCVGLGGGTGSGAAPEICRIAREEGVFLVVFATMPFTFEGERRTDQAKSALAMIARYANAVITFDNDRMGELIVPKDGVAQAFAAADKIISQSIRATMNVVFRPGIIRIGMDDLLSALDADDSRCLFGYGVAKGDNRSHEALEQALKCPLLDRGKLLNEARSVLVQVAGGDTMTLFEVQLVMDEVAKHVGKGTQILFGTGTDKRLGGSLTVTIISSIAGPGASSVRAAAQENEPAAPAISLGLSGVGEETQPAVRPYLPPAPPAPASPFDGVDEEQQPASLYHEEEAYGEVGFAEEEDTSVFEPLEEYEDALASGAEEVPAYAPEPIPSLYRPPALSDEMEEESFNPIARAVAGAPEGGHRLPPPVPSQDPSDFDRIEAVTEASQKITLTRVGSGGRTRDTHAASPSEAPILPASKAPTIPQEEFSPVSDEARQQQDLLQLEPAAGRTGRFAKTDPTIVDGEDLDVPTFLRKKR